jgi:hypothetical protein
MKLLKSLGLFLATALLLVACNSGQDNAPTEDPALSSETPAVMGAEACNTAPDAGPCKASMEKYYFDQATKKCTAFTYGGCEGTVPFETMDSCASACETQTTAANGCSVNGVAYNEGDSWSQACNTCTCTGTDNGPTAVCTNLPCDGATTDGTTTPQDTTSETTTINQGT